jgi:ribonuclease III
MDALTLIKVRQRLGLEFHDSDLLANALTPRMLRPPFESNPTFERLEFLGDAMIGAVVKAWLYDNRSEGPGRLTILFNALVSNQYLGRVSNEIGLLQLQIVEVNHLEYLLRLPKTTVLHRAADILEALVGSIFCDQGYAGAEKFILSTILPRLRELTQDGAVDNAKSMLQRMVMKDGGKDPVYHLIKCTERGPQGPIRTVKILSGERELARATGPTKVDAEVKAAKQALQRYYGIILDR